MSDIEIVIAAMGKIAYNFWPVVATVAIYATWEMISNNR
tara:strand:- start:868 stop:984 length:117 start_codon:yes stop_codon:yes gene_type:complete